MRGLLRKKLLKIKKLEDLETLSLRHFGEMYLDLEERMRKDLMARTDSEIIRFSKAVEKANKGNCWYAIYRIRTSLKDILKEVMKKKGTL